MARLSALVRSSGMVTLGMAFFQVLKGILALATLFLSASLFGAGIERDAWVLGWAAQLFVLKLIFGPINETLRARFIHLKSESGTGFALNSVSALVTCCMLVALTLMLLLLWRTDLAVHFFAPGISSPADQALVIRMTRLLLPNLLAGELIILLTALLNAYRTFILPEIMAGCSQLLNLLLLLFVAPVLGIDTLVLSNYLSVAALLVLLFLAIRKQRIRLRITAPRWPLIRSYLLFAAPFYVSYTAGQANVWAEKAMATYLGIGNTTVLDYARRFVDLPVTVISTIALSVMTPLLASIWVREQNSDLFRKEFLVLFRTILLLLLPVMVLFLICPEELVSFFMLRGHFDTAWLHPAAGALFFFGCALPGIAMYTFSGQALIVSKRPGVYAALGLAAQLLPIGLNLLWYPRYGLPFFALSWGAAHYICGLIMLWVAGVCDRRMSRQLVSLFILAALTLGICAVLHTYLAGWPAWQTIAAELLSCCVILLCLLFIFRMEELVSIRRFFRSSDG